MTVPPPDLSSLSWDLTHRQVAHGLADELRSTLFSQEEGTRGSPSLLESSLTFRHDRGARYGEMGETPSLSGGRELYLSLSGGRELYSQEARAGLIRIYSFTDTGHEGQRNRDHWI